MRRFLVNLKTVASSQSNITNLALGCEMWENGPVATIETKPPYQTRWFLNLDAVLSVSVWAPSDQDLPADVEGSIQILLVDQPMDQGYLQMVAGHIGLDLWKMDPMFQQFLQVTTGRHPEQPEDGCLDTQLDLVLSGELPLSRSGVN